MSTERLKLDEACKILFGPSFNYTEETVNYLQLSGIKTAFRERAKTSHPDLAKAFGVNEADLNVKFKKLTEAYNILINTLSDKSDLNIPEEKKQGKENFNNPGFKSYKDFLYAGKMPRRKLRFAEYLYYKKIISWKCLIDALVWQYKNRPRIGQICRAEKFLNDEEIFHILRLTSPAEKFGDAAVRNGFIKHSQLYFALKKQANYNLKVGDFFLKFDVLTEDALLSYLEQHKEFNISVVK